jgi:hypothetical protein
VTDFRAARDGWTRRPVEDLAGRPPGGRLVVREGATDFLAIERDQIRHLDGRYDLVGSHEREGRIGLADKPKFRVKRGFDLETGREGVRGGSGRYDPLR